MRNTRKYKYLLILLSFLFMSLQAHAEYYIKSNKNLELCQEFVKYLNRKSVDYYSEDLKEDEKFKGFSLLPMKEVEKKEWYQIYKLLIVSGKLDREKVEENWGKYEEYFYSNKVGVYLASADVNHDGKVENLLITSNKYFSYEMPKIYYVFYVLNNNWKFDENINISDYGNFFYYKGRFYIVNIGHVSNYFIYEPHVPKYSQGEYDKGMGVCDIHLKR